MVCMKCGRETAGEQVFCDDCLREMALHPVDPGTVIQLPTHKDAAPEKNSGRRQELSPRELLRRQRRQVRYLTAASLLLLLLLAAAIYLIIRLY